MSSVGSSSVGNMPPRHGKKLAEVMDEAFKNNSKQADDSEAEKPASDPPRTEAPTALSTDDSVSAPAKAPAARKIEGYTFQIASVYPPQPCERCIRSKKTCRGVEGARCEHCKSLHQKCSNSTGPPRGRHAGKSLCSLCSSYHRTEWLPFPAVTAVRQANTPFAVENGTGSSAEPARVKRKPAKKAVDEEEEDDDVEEGKAGPARKKRRVTGDLQGNVLKDIGELEGAIKKLQTSVAKDLGRLSQLASSLATQVRGMDN